ncbi:hypothetical protein M514_00618, partial [Trichuris suis]
GSIGVPLSNTSFPAFRQCGTKSTARHPGIAQIVFNHCGSPVLRRGYDIGRIRPKTQSCARNWANLHWL